MDDVFEDVVSDDAFSDEDDGDAPLSDDDIARVLGLMGDDGDETTASLTAATRHCGRETQPPTPQPAPIEKTTEAESVTASNEDEDKPNAVVATAQQPETSDFEQFLANFTLQQTTRSAEEVVKQPTPSQNAPVHAAAHNVPSLPLTSHREERQASPIASWKSVDSSQRRVDATASIETREPHNWGVFTPDKMPARREFGSVPIASKANPSAKTLKVVVVPSVAYLRTKYIRAPRASDPSSKTEWTFRPTINKAYFRRRGMARLRTPSTARFTSRMQRDITERDERQRRREADKQKTEERDARQFSQRRRSLVAKGSQAILERNGLWQESMHDRLERLYRPLHGRNDAPSSTATKSRERHQLREKEAAKTRACESLYQRGLDKLQRMRGESVAPSPKHASRRSSRRLESIVRARLERDVELICGHDSSPACSNSEPSPDSSAKDPSSVSFVEFSCVLLYFGFVPEANTPWEGDPQVTLLWHAWTTHTEGDGDARCVPMAVLKRMLESVIVKQHPHSSHQDSGGGPKARLLEIFRLNYIARKRSRGVSGEEPEHGAQQHKRKGRSDNVTYSLHGKVAQSKRAACTDLLEMRHSLAQQRIEAMRREKEQDELAECTFKPRLSSTSSSAAKAELASTYRFREADEVSSVSSAEPEAFDRLYGDAFVRQNNNRIQYIRARYEEEEKCKREMRISPTYVNGLTIEERLDRLHESLSNNAVPAHFYEKIAEMRHAYAAKVDDAREKASRLEPAHVFPRSRGGHTIVVPFTFATQQRTTENRRKGQSSLVQSSTTTMASALRAMRLQRAPVMEAATATAARMKTARGSEEIGNTSDAADLCIDVHVSPFETYLLCLNQGDDVYEATRVFADAYNLDPNQRKQLEHDAHARLEQLFDL